ncbi:MAG: hypothetical protein ACRD2X_09415 [Vicinamibacteraceae bacterium]
MHGPRGFHIAANGCSVRGVLERIFFWSAVIMSGTVLLHLVLRSEPLRTQMSEPVITE